MKTIVILAIILFATRSAVTDNVSTRFKIPPGYHIQSVPPGSFGAYLQSIPLKPAGTPTKTYKGEIAGTDIFTAAVVDMSVGHADLQQCADAVMRLRGEYLYQQKKYGSIAFHFTSGFNCDYIHYANGYRYANDHWVLKAKKDYGYETFMRYMTLVFSYAGTLSLQKELKSVKDVNELKAGDVFIRGGSPGHCFIVMEVIANNQNQKKFLLAQSFMPAQNIQVLQDHGNPWFSLQLRSNIWYGELIDKALLKSFD